MDFEQFSTLIVCVYHLYSILPSTEDLTPLYGLYDSPVTLSWSILIRDREFCGISKVTMKDLDGFGACSLQ